MTNITVTLGSVTQTSTTKLINFRPTTSTRVNSWLRLSSASRTRSLLPAFGAAKDRLVPGAVLIMTLRLTSTNYIAWLWRQHPNCRAKSRLCRKQVSWCLFFCRLYELHRPNGMAEYHIKWFIPAKSRDSMWYLQLTCFVLHPSVMMGQFSCNRTHLPLLMQIQFATCLMAVIRIPVHKSADASSSSFRSRKFVWLCEFLPERRGKKKVDANGWTFCPGSKSDSSILWALLFALFFLSLSKAKGEERERGKETDTIRAIEAECWSWRMSSIHCWGSETPSHPLHLVRA